MANPLEPAGQHMQQETADELIGTECHGLGPVAMPAILPAKGDLTVIGADQPMVGNDHAMGITAQVLQDLLGATEGGLGIDDPVGVAQRREVLGKGLRLAQCLERREELEFVRLVCPLQGV